MTATIQFGTSPFSTYACLAATFCPTRNTFPFALALVPPCPFAFPGPCPFAVAAAFVLERALGSRDAAIVAGLGRAGRVIDTRDPPEGVPLLDGPGVLEPARERLMRFSVCEYA
jgi:hypothetical protein